MIILKLHRTTAKRLVCCIERALSTNPDLSSIRNIGIVAHIDAGKTTVTERMLLETGAIGSAGSIKHGNTTTDYLECEQERGITVNSAFVQAQWKDHRLNVIDTPGHIDFNFEVERSLRVLDGSLVVIDGTRGVEAQTLTVWRQLQKFDVPKLIFLNKLDRQLRNVPLCLSSIRSALNAEPVLLNYPVFDAESNLVGVSQRAPSLDDMTATVESLANIDGVMEELYLNNDLEADKISVEDVMSSIVRLHKAGKIVPVCVGSGYTGVGITSCLDYIVDLLPSPSEAMSKLPAEFKDGICGVVFKSSLDRHRGVLCQSRMYSGTLKPRSLVYNTRTMTTGKVSALFQLEAGSMINRAKCVAGEIGVFAGCDDFRTGDIFVSEHWRDDKKKLQEIISSSSILKSSLSCSKPLFFCNVECESSLDQEKLEKALSSMTFEDPTLVLKKGSNDELLLGGNGQLHLSVVQDRLEQEHGMKCKAYQFRVNYMETVVEPIHCQLDQDSRTIEIVISPYANAELLNHITVNISDDPGKKTSEGNESRGAVERAVNTFLSIGPLVGLHMANCSVEVQISCYGQPTSIASLSALARQGMKAAFRSSPASLAISEPYAGVEVEGPASCSGTVISDFTTRIGSSDYEVTYDKDHVRFSLAGHTALAKLSDYVARVRSLSRGTATVNKIEMTEYVSMEPRCSQDVVQRFKTGQLSM